MMSLCCSTVSARRMRSTLFVGGQPRQSALSNASCAAATALDIVRLHIGHGSQFFAGTGVVGAEGVAVGGEHLPTADHGS